jgi:hypothetical protein
VGLGRSYVQLEKLDYDSWCEGVRQGRNYVGDGRSHLLDFKANGAAMGFNDSELRLSQPGRVTLTARVAARLDEKPNPDLSERPYEKPPYWHIERARIGKTRRCPSKFWSMGDRLARKNIQADGELRDVSFDVDIPRSSWVALRILPSSHTNPIFVLVDGKPIRASRQSVQWCLDAVNQCWTQKERFLKGEVEEGRRAYEHAREVYRQRLTECDVN